MIPDDPKPLSEVDRALVECLRIFARRGRAIREAKEKGNRSVGYEKVPTSA
jgi:hypothetical protein